MNRKKGGLLLVCAFAAWLSGCSVTEQEAIELSYEAFLTEFEEEPSVPNTETKNIAFYMPRGFDIVEETEYNLLLQRGEQLFVLFHQPEELQTSTIHLERDREFEQEAVAFHVVETDEHTAYFWVNEEDDEQLHVVTALGGAKLSTLTTYDDLVKDVELMMDILLSYEVRTE
ncbi:hypothetical protein [Halalkalibacter oceani]|uniref:hypothetical protein n=1 Tax=Halalkalibacter oceani TaxID=1653776 RepID=UPI003390C625